MVIRSMVMGRSIALAGSVSVTGIQTRNNLCFNCEDPMAVRRKGTCRFVTEESTMLSIKAVPGCMMGW